VIDVPQPDRTSKRPPHKRTACRIRKKPNPAPRVPVRRPATNGCNKRGRSASLRPIPSSDTDTQHPPWAEFTPHTTFPARSAGIARTAFATSSVSTRYNNCAPTLAANLLAPHGNGESILREKALPQKAASSSTGRTEISSPRSGRNQRPISATRRDTMSVCQVKSANCLESHPLQVRVFSLSSSATSRANP
jgi:hypothetical protein